MLSKRTLETVADCIRRARGREICGFLLVDGKGGQQFHAVRNMSNERHTFFVSQFDFKRLNRHAARNGTRIVAFIHSHQSCLELSDQDVRSLEASGLPWIVVTPSGPGVRYKVYEKSTVKEHEGKT